MAKKRKELTSSKVREILRLGLKYQLGDREISRSCGVSHVTVWAYLKQVKESGLSWTDVSPLDETQILKLVRGAHQTKPNRSIPEPDWEYIHTELRKKGVTLQLYGRSTKNNIRTDIRQPNSMNITRGGNGQSAPGCVRITRLETSCLSTMPGRPSRYTARKPVRFIKLRYL